MIDQKSKTMIQAYSIFTAILFLVAGAMLMLAMYQGFAASAAQSPSTPGGGRSRRAPSRGYGRQWRFETRVN